MSLAPAAPIGKSPPALPSDIEAEQAMLGAILVNNDALAQVSAFLRAEHFHEPLHQRIFEAAADLIGIGRLASPTTLRLYFSRDAAMRQIGGPAYLAELAKFAPTVINAADFARMIVELAARRALIKAAQEVIDTAQDPPVSMSAMDVMAYGESTLGEVSRAFDTSEAKQFRSVTAFAKEAVDGATTEEKPGMVGFGVRALDDLTGGMRPGEFIVVGARPGMGKSSIAAHIALSQAEQGRGVGFFSLEMTGAAIALRLACAVAYHRSKMQIWHEKARKGRSHISEPEMNALFAAEEHLRTLPVWIHEGRRQTISQLCVQARQLKRSKEFGPAPLRLVIVDHLQKVMPDRRLNNRVGEMTDITDALQKLAGELQVPVIALSQLNREAEKREEQKPRLADLRESGSIEQDADMVLLLYRQAYYVQKSEPHPNSPDHTAWYNKLSECRTDLEIIIAKQRHGSEGTIRAYFDAPSSAILYE